MNSHELALLLLEWPNGAIMVEVDEKYYDQVDVEVDLDGNVHLVGRDW